MKIITLGELRDEIDFDMWEIEASVEARSTTVRARALRRLRRSCERHSDLSVWPDIIFSLRRLLRLDRGGIEW